MTRFPIGSWVKDQTQEGNHGLVQDSHGRWGFQPYRGQVKRWGHIGRTPAYVIQFGEHEGLILADGASCDSCGTLDDSDHSPLCYEMAVRGQRKVRRYGYAQES